MDVRSQAMHKTLFRDMRLDVAGLGTDSESRTVRAALSSEYAVERPWGIEVLEHSAEAIDMSRAAEGLPLLWNHDSDRLIGAVNNIRLDADRVLRGTLTLSRNPRGSEVLQDIRDELLKSVSIGYRIDDIDDTTVRTDGRIRVTRWTPLEISMAPVPADASVGINRSLASKEPAMAAETETPATPVAAPAAAAVATPVVDLGLIRRDLDIARADAAQLAIRAERERVNEINAAFEMSVVPATAEFRALRARALQDGWSVDQARKLILEALGQQAGAPVAQPQSDPAMGVPSPEAAVGTRTSVSTDALDKFKAGVSEALIVRAGIDASRETVQRARSGGFVGMRLSRIAERYLALAGVDPNGLNDDQIAQRALVTRAGGMTTSDFANILVNTANKALLLGWDQAPETWQQWVRIGQVPDFKSATRTGLSGFSSLAVVPEDGEITYGKFTDRKETIQAVSYAKKFRLTYQAIKNDDLNAFTAIPRGMGRAAQSVIGDIVYALLDGVGPTLNQDSIALWDTSTHKNYVAAATAPNVTTLDTAFTAMAKQTDPNTGKPLNIAPRYLLVPKALETTARVLNTSMYDPAASPGSTTGKNTLAPNPFQNRLEVISDTRLDVQTNGTAAWYLAADPNRFDTIEVAFVDGIAEPYLREEQEWDTRGVEYVVGVDFGVAALDFRALHKYKGNT